MNGAHEERPGFASAAWLLVWASAKNRATRLFKQPRYLVFTIAGLCYFVSLALRRVSSSTAVTSALSPSLILGVGFGVLVYVALAWLFGADRAALAFTEPEVQFFFPAPIRRRSLIHYKLLRMLLGALVVGPVLALAMQKTTVYGAIGYFFAYSTLAMHRLAASLTRASLLEHGLARIARRLLTAIIVLGVAGGIVWSFVQAKASLPPLGGTDAPTLQAAFEAWAAAHVDTLHWALFPVVAVLRVMHATTPGELVRALPAAAGVLAFHYVWAASTSAAFEESEAEAAESRARRLASGRAGVVTRGGPLFHLEGKGPPWVGIVWKNLLAQTRITRVQIFRWVVLLMVVPITTVVGARGSGTALVVLLIGAVTVATMAAMLGPHIVHNDLRGDLSNIDILRSYPLSGRDIVVAELFAPWLLLTAIEWVLLAAAVALGVVDGHHDGVFAAYVAGGLAVVLPMVTAAALYVRNALVLAFPSLVASATSGVRSFEATGQRLLVMIGTLLVLALLLLPAGAIAAGIAFLLARWLPFMAALDVAVLAGAVVAATELYLGLGILGRAFERFDVTRG